MGNEEETQLIKKGSKQSYGAGNLSQNNSVDLSVRGDSRRQDKSEADLTSEVRRL